jgi:Glycosyltransferase family 25 (LPS biosynthesis protein)
MIHLTELACLIITVKGHAVSEAYRDYVLPFWHEQGIFPETFDAITPDTMVEDIDFYDVAMTKYVQRGFRKPFTPTEKAVWFSHIGCWRRVIDHGAPMLILEHDAFPQRPAQFWYNPVVSYQAYDKGAMGCYVITPDFAAWMINWLYNIHGKIDSGPGSLINWVRTEKFSPYKIITTAAPDYVSAATQVIDRRFGTVIDHYTGTPAEHIDWHEFPFYKEITLPLA